MRKEGETQILFDTVLLGIVGGLAAVVFDASLRFCSWLFLWKLAAFRAPGLPDEGGVLKEVTGLHRIREFFTAESLFIGERRSEGIVGHECCSRNLSVLGNRK